MLRILDIAEFAADMLRSLPLFAVAAASFGLIRWSDYQRLASSATLGTSGLPVVDRCRMSQPAVLGLTVVFVPPISASIVTPFDCRDTDQTAC